MKVNEFFNFSKTNSLKNLYDSSVDKNKVFKKIYFDENELSAKKIIKVWESLSATNEKLSRPNNWIKFKMFLTIIKLRGIIGRLLKKIFPKNFSQVSYNKEDFKFPSLREKDILERVTRLQHILGIKEKIDCKILSEKTILIKRS